MEITFLAVLALGITPVLFIAALAVRFGGKAPVLNFVDYSAYKNPAALNKKVGNILLLLPLLSFITGSVTLAFPEFGLLCVVSFIPLFLAVIAYAVVSANLISDQQRAD